MSELKDGGSNIEFPGPLTKKAVKVIANSLVADPKLGALQNINGVLVRPLLAGSPAINSGVAGAKGQFPMDLSTKAQSFL
ncbi:choice-of-anchor Q domain-containing protein [Nostoc sp. UHCC 0302]|uniref:choice-of-anchor Q domain-containing protein n=1 Tax=Nostoc sp. UHCC 0302 TaxID=3134896 RepID=UPI00311CC84B